MILTNLLQPRLKDCVAKFCNIKVNLFNTTCKALLREKILKVFQQFFMSYEIHKLKQTLKKNNFL